ncbi:electron transfer flavoprotein beta subunit [Paenibacillus cellulosilyticus]|uniref:Electron transfer flavoprotein subunit beta n=1 Tax=Paenibacillus cellulosilyticus TaxID=375489 RepID=A0A2V2YPC0_9BACL|nr:electron transfer flavoprotein subunit beta/FixA family protein [Paenibacillus cellulosilyticus]PWV98005.1 electron transfer flavoprotein beta subunit [Paenibacillus cellulosilyticus]QKS43970.1 electron transfer flavoprotein subunit beta/FixA family protein [Paenibacillus cellulosilyticus]
MNIVVLVKQTFDTEEKIVVQGGTVSQDGVKLIVNPYDEYALEEALRLREKHGGTVTALTCGNEQSAEALRTALAMGADEAIRLEVEPGDDSASLAAAIAAVVRPLKPDLLLAGLFAVDTGSGSVALQVAERLGIPHASAVVKLAVNGGTLVADRDVEGDIATVEVPLPALVTAQQGLNEPRYPSLPGIMKAKRKPLRVVSRSELAADAAAPASLRLSVDAVPPRAAGKRLGGGTPSELAAELAKLLHEEAKVL